MSRNNRRRKNNAVDLWNYWDPLFTTRYTIGKFKIEGHAQACIIRYEYAVIRVEYPVTIFRDVSEGLMKLIFQTRRWETLAKGSALL